MHGSGRQHRKDNTLRQRGISLLEVSVVLALLAGAAVLLLPSRQEMPSYTQEAVVLDAIDRQLVHFIATHSRLPCPDYSGDGFEDCSGDHSGKGSPPFRTLGMSSGSYGLTNLPLIYSVYRAPSSGGALSVNDADLTASVNRFEPTMADGTRMDFRNTGAADFCRALVNGDGNAYSGSRTYVRNGQGENRNVAYAIASPGRFNSDGQHGLFDGINASTAYGFMDDATPISGDYDDRVISRGFNELNRMLQCDELVQSLNLIANGRQTEMTVSDELSANMEAAIVAAAMNGFGFVTLGVDYIQSGIAAYNAALQLSAAAGLLAGAIGSCAVLVGCAMIAVYAVSVAAATAGVAAAAVAIAATVPATISHTAATAMYIAAAIQLSLTDLEFDSADASESIEQIESQVAEVKQSRDETQAKFNAASNEIASLESAVDSTRNSIENYMTSNSGPSSSSRTTVLNAMNTMENRIQNRAQAEQQYRAVAEEYQQHKLTCDDLKDPDVDNPYDGDPAEHESCIAEANLRGNYESAETQLENASSDQSQAINSAISAGNNFQVHTSTNEEGEAQYSSCSSVGSCNLGHNIAHYETVENDEGDDVDIVRGYAGDLNELHSKRAEKDMLEAQLAEQNQTVSDLEQSLGALKCQPEGQQWDEDSEQCVDPDSVEEREVVQIQFGASDVLEAIESRNLLRLQ